MRRTAVAVVLASLMAGMTVLAQQPPEFPKRQQIPEAARQFIGTWMRFPPGAGNPERGNCGNLLDQHGKPRLNCSLPVDKLKFHPRMFGWIQYFDEVQAPVYECAAHTVPTLLGDVRPFRITAEMDSLLVNYEMGNTMRRIWTDGRGHPPPYQLIYQGHAIGKWVGNELWVETTNFTFDPDGLDDHAHLPSSVRKRVIERYRMTGPDEMTIEITVEDPTFLLEPGRWQHRWRRNTTRQFDGFAECDPDVTRREIELTTPEKYPVKGN